MAVDDKILSEQDLGLSGMGGLGSLKSEEGIPYKTSQEVVPLSEGGGYFYGTSATPSQRFIFRKIMTDAEGNPQKLFENFNTLDDIEKQFIAESDQRREELTPEELSTLDLLKDAGIITAVETGKPVVKAGLQAFIEGGDVKDAAKGALPFVQSDLEKQAAFSGQFGEDFIYNEAVSNNLVNNPNQVTSMKSAGTLKQIEGPRGEVAYAVDVRTPEGRLALSSPSGGSYAQFQRPPGQSYDPNFAATIEDPYAAAVYSGTATPENVGKGYTGPTVKGTGTGGFFSKESFKSRYDQAFKTETLGTNFMVDFAVNLALGDGKPKERIEAAAKTAALSTAGTAIGTAIGGPVGGFIGGTIGSVVASGGSVICSELYRQKLITKEDYFINLRFTQSHILPKRGYDILHGYWCIGIPAVRLMRRNKTATKFWKHIFQKRTLDLKWRLGKGKFNLLGRAYNLIFENTCALVGKFCNEQDYKILYKEKANG
jgi:hypothetical protein